MTDKHTHPHSITTKLPPTQQLDPLKPSKPRTLNNNYSRKLAGFLPTSLVNCLNFVGEVEGMAGKYENDDDMNFKATELRLGLPGTEESEKQTVTPPSARNNNKRALADIGNDQSGGSNNNSSVSDSGDREVPPAAKQQVVGWPPVRSYRKNTLQTKNTEVETPGMYVKVSMDGAPYLRKIDLKVYNGYPELLKALENMFKFTIGKYSEREGYNGSEHAPTYEDKDGDWMLVGDVPWDMFISSCKRLRIMKGSEARGLGCGV